MTTESDIREKKRSRLWYLLPIFMNVIGGLIAYYLVRGTDAALGKNVLWLGIILSAIVSTLALIVYLSYLSDMNQTRERLSTGKVIKTTYGPIQYVDVGQGVPILSIHGAGGGFDQGIITAESFFGKDSLSSHRLISPSRFGYLQTPLPTGDAGPAAQADAHAALLDALGVHEKVIVLGTSAGALSAQEFAIKYPDRVSALILAVPAVWSPEQAEEGSATIGSDNFIAKTVMRSDFAMWVFSKVAYSQLLTYVGVPENLQGKMNAQEKVDAKRLIDAILPVSEKVDGGTQEATNMASMKRLSLESITAPTLVIDAKDVITYPGSKYAAEHIPNARLVSFEKGGHLLIGHGDDAKLAVKNFVQQLTNAKSFTIDVAGQRFTVQATDPTTIQQLTDNFNGKNTMHITGILVADNGGFNYPYSWHLDPATVRMAEMSIELCDSSPSYVEQNLDYLGLM